MRWRPREGEPDPRRWTFPLLPLILDDGLRIMWEPVYYKITIIREWGGMGADGCEGYRDYWDIHGDYLGKLSFRS